MNNLSVERMFFTACRDTLSRLKRDLELASRFGFALSLKLVRGAYVRLEKSIAEESNEPMQVHDSIENTHESYDACVQLLFDHIDRIEVFLGKTRNLYLEEGLLPLGLSFSMFVCFFIFASVHLYVSGCLAARSTGCWLCLPSPAYVCPFSMGMCFCSPTVLLLLLLLLLMLLLQHLTTPVRSRKQRRCCVGLREK